MNCKQVSELLPLYADGELEEDDSRVVDGHLACCQECRRRLDADRTLSGALAGLSRSRAGVIPPPTLKPRVMARVGNRRRWEPLWRGAALLGRAAAVLALVAIVGAMAAALTNVLPTFLAERTGRPEVGQPWQVLREELVHEPYYWVLEGERIDRAPQLSPDGTRIAYLPTVEEQATDLDHIVVRDIASGEERDLTPEEGYSYTSVRWSPDGKALAFVKFPTVGGVSPTEVWRIDADGSNLKLLYRPLPVLVGRRGPAVTIVRWSADGKQIELAPTVWSDGGPLRTISAEGGGEETQLVPAPAWFQTSQEALVGDTVFSPAGDYALHVVREGTPSQAEEASQEHSLVLYDPKTQRTSTLASFAQAVYISPSSISPDGEWVAVRSAAPTAGGGLPEVPIKLWVVRRDGSGPSEVTGLPEDRVLGSMLWANGGRGYLTASPQLWDSRADGQLYEVDAEHGQARMIAQETFPAELVSVSHDGRWALVVRGAGESASLHLLELGPMAVLSRPATPPSESVVPSPAGPTPAPTAGTIVAGPPAQLASLRMFDSTTGWALSSAGGAILRTVDGGNMWMDVTPPGLSAGQDPNTVALGDVDFAERDVAFLLVPDKSGQGSTLWRTYDGGINWEALTTPAPNGLVEFVGREYGWIAATLGVAAGSSPKDIYRTSDGGASWELVSQALPDQQGDGFLPFGGHLRGLSFLDANTGWAFGITYAPGRPWLYVTRDGGRTWQEENLPIPAEYAEYSVLADAPRFFSVRDAVLPVRFSRGDGASTLFFVTQDCGLTWSQTSPVKAEAGSGGVAQAAEGSGVYDFVDPENGWVTGWPYANDLYRTQDGGRTWSALAPNVPWQDVVQLDFVDEQVGWALQRTEEAIYLLESKDGGQTWDVLKPVLAVANSTRPTPPARPPVGTQPPEP